MINNYFRVERVGIPRPTDVFPFDDTCTRSTAQARSEADQAFHSLNALAVYLWRVPVVPGPWSQYPLVGSPNCKRFSRARGSGPAVRAIATGDLVRVRLDGRVGTVEVRSKGWVYVLVDGRRELLEIGELELVGPVPVRDRSEAETLPAPAEVP